MNIHQQNEPLNAHIRLLYKGETDIAMALEILQEDWISNDLMHFLRKVANENQKAVVNLCRIDTRLEMAKKRDKHIKNIIFDMCGSIAIHAKDVAAIQTIIITHFHALMRYQVGLYNEALLIAMETPDFNATHFLSECLNNKKVLNTEIEQLDKQVVKHRREPLRQKKLIYG
jgi:ferritin-like metal-binding protein YciE